MLFRPTLFCRQRTRQSERQSPPRTSAPFSASNLRSSSQLPDRLAITFGHEAHRQADLVQRPAGVGEKLACLGKSLPAEAAALSQAVALKSKELGIGWWVGLKLSRRRGIRRDRHEARRQLCATPRTETDWGIRISVLPVWQSIIGEMHDKPLIIGLDLKLFFHRLAAILLHLIPPSNNESLE